jgi:hypothetical protein
MLKNLFPIIPVESYFGGCPECGKTDGYANVGRSHWFFCKPHKTKWCIGSNLFSGWRSQTEDEQRRAYDAIGLGAFTEVEPLPCTENIDQQAAHDLDQIPVSDDRQIAEWLAARGEPF